jgi:hypothetical protein
VRFFLLVVVMLAPAAWAQSSSSSGGGSSSSSSGGVSNYGGPVVWSCAGAAAVGSDAEGDDVPVCEQGYGSWQPAPVPFWEQQLDQSSMNDLLAAIISLACAVWVARKVGEFLENAKSPD